MNNHSNPPPTSPIDVVSLLEFGAKTQLTEQQIHLAEQLIMKAKQECHNVTLLDVIDEFKKHPLLCEFAELCGDTFLVGGDYSNLF